MSLSQFYKNIDFDIERRMINKLRAKQGDKGSRGFYVRVLNDGRIEDISTYTMTAHFTNANNVPYKAEGRKSGGLFQIDIPGGVFDAYGKVKGELVLKDGSTAILADETFIIEVEESVRLSDNGGVEDSQFELLENRVDELEKIGEEVISARYSGYDNHTYNKIGERIDTVEARVAGDNITDYTSAPGSKVLIAGDRNNGFYGFVQASEFGKIIDNLEASQDFNGKNLALAIGLSSGTSQHENTSWMKFSRNGEIYFVPVKPIRHTLSWNSIYNQGAVYGDDTMGVNPPNGRAGNTISVSETDNSFRIDEIEGHWQRDGAVIATVGDTIVAKGFTEDENNGEFEVTAITDYKITVNKTLVAEARSDKVSVYKKTDGVKQDREVTIGDNKYKVQLLKGAASDPLDSYADGDRGLVGEASEWNSLILPLHERAKLQDWNYKGYAGTTEDWGVGLSDKDLVTHHTLGLGNYTWCQETGDTHPARRVFRGGDGASNGSVRNSWHATWSRGWCPVLRLIN